MEVVIVSRHPATINLLKQYFPEAKVVEHLEKPEDIPEGSLVIGNLPIEMVARLLDRGCKFVMVSLNIPRELRGKELGEEELKKYMDLIAIHELKIEKLNLAEFEKRFIHKKLSEYFERLRDTMAYLTIARVRPDAKEDLRNKLEEKYGKEFVEDLDKYLEGSE